jgi:hypothetical protein
VSAVMPPFPVWKFDYHSELAGRQAFACSPGLREQRANFGVGSLIEVAIELADSVEGIGGFHADDLVDFSAQIFASAGCCDGHSNKNPASDGTKGARRGFHAGAGREAIVDEKGGAVCEEDGGTTAAVCDFPALDLKPLTR